MFVMNRSGQSGCGCFTRYPAFIDVYPLSVVSVNGVASNGKHLVAVQLLACQPCGVCGLQDCKCLNVIVCCIIWSGCTQCERPLRTSGVVEGMGACEMMVWCGWLKKGQECQCLVIHCLPDILMSSVCRVLMQGVRRGVWKKGREGKEKRKSKKGGARKSGEKKEKHKSISKKTKDTTHFG